MSKRKRLTIGTCIILTVVLVIGVGLVVVIYIAPPSIPESCFPPGASGVTPAEVAKSLKLPLVAFSMLPTNVSDIPLVRLHQYEYVSDYSCGVAIDYFQHGNKTRQIEVLLHRELQGSSRPYTGLPLTCSSSPPQSSIWIPQANLTLLNCIDYSNPDQVGFQSSCAGTISDGTQTFNIIFATQYNSETTKQISCSAVFLSYDAPQANQPQKWP